MTPAQRYPNGSRSGDGLPPVTSIPLSEEPAGAMGPQSIGGLVREATTHLSTLIRAEIELARTEITAEVRKGLRGSIFFLIALTLALLLTPFLLVTIALVIAIWLPQWAGFGIVTGAMVFVAVAFAILGLRKVRKIHAPQRTISSVRDTASALRRHGEPAGPHFD